MNKNLKSTTMVTSFNNFLGGIIILCVCALTSCSSDKTYVDQLKGEIDSLSNKVDSLSNLATGQEDIIKQQHDTITLLKYPADQRLAKIKTLISEENYSEAKSEIASLQEVFPNSSEAAECPSLIQSIDTKLAEIEAEKERIRALGFKALQTSSKVSIDYNTVSISGISVGGQFVHDVYGSYSNAYVSETVDRGNKFIVAEMSVTSTSKDPNIPTLAVYSIKGDQLDLEGTCRIEMSRWDDYGTYLGNDPDNNNDFAKVSTVKFKLGCELPESVLSKPYMVVLKKTNTQSRYYKQFRRPNIYYSGTAGYPNMLNIDNFNNGDYVAIKIANL